ncbi:MAG: Flp family type IVb pilin [Chloroflexi bacterium]|nr:Flp family type IVb pilin [Chloroflexota bacterium]
MKLIDRLVRKDKGQGLLEYSLILAFVVLVTVGALGLFGDEVNAFFNDIAGLL